MLFPKINIISIKEGINFIYKFTLHLPTKNTQVSKENKQKILVSKQASGAQKTKKQIITKNHVPLANQKTPKPRSKLLTPSNVIGMAVISIHKCERID